MTMAADKIAAPIILRIILNLLFDPTKVVNSGGNRLFRLAGGTLDPHADEYVFMRNAAVAPPCRNVASPTKIIASASSPSFIDHCGRSILYGFCAED
jgi:hypothetical protein